MSAIDKLPNEYREALRDMRETISEMIDHGIEGLTDGELTEEQASLYALILSQTLAKGVTDVLEALAGKGEA